MNLADRDGNSDNELNDYCYNDGGGQERHTEWTLGQQHHNEFKIDVWGTKTHPYF